MKKSVLKQLLADCATDTADALRENGAPETVVLEYRLKAAQFREEAAWYQQLEDREDNT